MRMPRLSPWRRPHEVSEQGELPDILEWARLFRPAAREWLILGKGPSYELIHHFDVTPFFVCGLNHVARERPVDLAHVIDVDVVEDCGEQLERNARYVVMPFYPHLNHRPTGRTLMDFADSNPVLRSLRAEGRLVGYNLSSAARKVGTSPVIESRCFSAEAAVDILGTCGVRRIRTLGPLPPLALARVLRQHDVYLTASVNDPASNALLEALACGLPALYLRSGGHAEITRGPLFRPRLNARSQKLAERAMDEATMYRLIQSYLTQLPGAVRAEGPHRAVDVDHQRVVVARRDTARTIRRSGAD